MTDGNTTLHDWLSLSVDALTPITVVLIGFLARRYADQLDRRREMTTLRTTWRLEIGRELFEELNVLCRFYTYVGDWREIGVDRATRAKRRCDQLVAANEFLWSKQFIADWEEFKKAAFVENSGPGQDFLFRANVERHRENPGFLETWERRFVGSGDRIRRDTFRPLFDRVVRQAATDIGIIS
jgi:hypothetical protein